MKKQYYKKKTDLEQRLDNFFQACKQKGLDLLRDDEEFISKCVHTLAMYNKDIHGILNRYVRLWLSAYAKESIDHKKDNQGRYAANTYIRELSATP